MYRYCPLCKCRNLITLEQHTQYSEYQSREISYTVFRCKECGYRFCIDEEYLDSGDNQGEQGVVLDEVRL